MECALHANFNLKVNYLDKCATWNFLTNLLKTCHENSEIKRLIIINTAFESYTFASKYFWLYFELRFSKLMSFEHLIFLVILTLEGGWLHLWFASMWLHDAVTSLYYVPSHNLAAIQFQSKTHTTPLLTTESPVAHACRLEHPTRSQWVVGSNSIWNSDFFPSWCHFYILNITINVNFSPLRILIPFSHLHVHVTSTE